MHIRNLPFRGYFYAALILSALLCIFVIFAKSSLPPVVPIFYGRPVGTGQLIPALGLLIIPGTTFIVSVVNATVASNIKHTFLRKILAMASFFVTILGAITLIKIVLLVGFW